MSNQGYSKIPVKMPDWHDKWLRVWAYTKSSSKSALASHILQSNIEENIDCIQRIVKELASDRGIPEDELIAQILGEE